MAQSKAEDDGEEEKILAEMNARIARDKAREDREALERKEKLWQARLETGVYLPACLCSITVESECSRVLDGVSIVWW